MQTQSEGSHEWRLIAVTASATLAAGIASALGLAIPTLLAILAIGSAVALTALPHLSVALIVFLTFTNASMVVAETFAFNNLTETLLLLAIAIALLDFRKRRRLPAMLPYIAFGMTIYVVSLAMTAFYAYDPGSAYDEAILALKRVLLVVALSAIIPDVKRFRWAILGLIAGATFLGFLTVVQSVLGIQDQDFLGFAQVTHAEIADQIDSWRYVGPVNDPNYYAQLLLLGLPVALTAIVASRSFLWRAIFFAAAGFILGAMLLTVSRGAIVALLVVLVVAFRSQRKRLLLAGIAMLLVGSVAINFVPDVVVNRFSGVYKDVSSVISGNGFVADKAIAGRLAEMEVAVRLFFEHPLLGIGYNNYDGLYQDVARVNSLMSRGQAREAHSLYLEILSERGLVGFFFFVSLISLAIWSAGAGARIMLAGGHRMEASLSNALILSITAYLATSFFLHEAFSSSFWVLIALAVTAPQAALSPMTLRPQDRAAQATALKKDDVQFQAPRAEKQKLKNGTQIVTSRPAANTRSSSSPFDIVATFRRYLFVILGAAVLTGGMGAIAPMNSEQRYAADGSLLFRFEREYFPQNVARTEYQGEPIRTLVDGAIQTEMEILGSRDVVKGAILRSGYMEDGDLLTERMPAFIKALSLRRVEGTQLVRVSFEDTSPDTAVRAISALFNSYLDRRAKLFETRPEEVLRDVTDETRSDLATLRGDLARVERQIGVMNAAALGAAAPAADEGIDTLSEVTRLTIQQEALLTEIQLAEGRYEMLSGLLSEEELANRVEEARGPAIKVLEAPEADPAPIGLPPIAYGIISGLMGLVLAAFIAIWVDWSRATRAQRERETTS
ncbi:O-antigen ligase family protein [Sinisalibacter aestuarii]|uniref:O-antigen ligase-related domain-containing protein n=1 Tax=Sinisalibacter aestuarii TaxID=2949426 RepID=A0ABQ5LT27_9RHOB|nr:O-antigen ligase family protein [Sinisalibacter aestuarii]GKY88145.1 hypothetical protein STA1M1_20140 [Sinisalibacter aestuarii]